MEMPGVTIQMGFHRRQAIESVVSGIQEFDIEEVTDPYHAGKHS
jgi:hypothetical protein